MCVVVSLYDCRIFVSFKYYYYYQYKNGASIKSINMEKRKNSVYASQLSDQWVCFYDLNGEFYYRVVVVFVYKRKWRRLALT